MDFALYVLEKGVSKCRAGPASFIHNHLEVKHAEIPFPSREVVALIRTKQVLLREEGKELHVVLA